jgi:two-component system sensor histidine kinase RegB
MPIGKLKQEIQPSPQNLLRLCLMRSIVIIALLTILSWLHFEGTVVLPMLPLIVVLSVTALINVLVILRLRSDWPVSEAEFFANLLLDVLFLTLVLYFTGGSTNPVVSYYLIPLIISAAVLRPAHTWFIAFLSIAFYTLLLFYYRPLALFTMSGHGAMTSAHFLGMWINFGFSALLISWFVVRMAATLKEQSRAIARSRETGLRHEQIISAASIAAGTAHEMRTPLATMAVTVDDISYEHPELKQEMAILEEQIERCDSVLRELVSTNSDESQMKVTRFGVFWYELLDKWSLARPEIKLTTSISDRVSPAEIRYDQSLQHALMSLLNNAADASPEHVAMRADLSDGSILITIEDRGPGIPVEIADSLGKKYISRKQGGLGLGVLLSQSSIERLGGNVTMQEAAGKGTRLEIRMSLHEVDKNG